MATDPNAPVQPVTAATPASVAAITPAVVPKAKPVVAAPSKVTREITGTIRSFKLPGNYTKHPNPVGRPKNPRG